MEVNGDILPAEFYADKIKDAIAEHETVIICGQTGCGKSTVIPQIILDNKLIGNSTCIAVTQPRRVAASSLAVKVSQDRSTELGKEVGYKYRFDNMTSEDTRLVYITDGMLLKEYSSDKSLKKYTCVILDEVHERSVNSDILMWCLRRVQIERNETRRKLKLVLMSATMELEPLKKYFNAPAFYIPGRLHKVELFYCEKIRIEANEHVENAVQTVLQLHESEPIESSFLVFLTGQDEIEAACNMIRRKIFPQDKVRLIPFYAQKRQEDVNDIFRLDKNSRKIIVATNIAETSITIPDVRVVVDSGKVKQKRYLHERRFSVLEVKSISQAQAIQRAGRAGRCADGKCYRLYSRQAYEALDVKTTPEILRTSLSEVLLNLFAANINALKGFKFLDNPSIEEWCTALDELIALELIEARMENNVYRIETYLALDERKKFELNYHLTELGDKVKRLPVSPMLARLIAMSSHYGCLQEGLIIASFCSVDDFILPVDLLSPEEAQQHEIFLRNFFNVNGDLARLVVIYRHYKKQSRNVRYDWCKSTGLNFHRLEEVLEIRKQLRNACQKAGLEFNSSSQENSLKKAITNSFYLNTCVYSNKQDSYKTAGSKETVFVHPSSCLFRLYPTTVVYTELIRTSKLYMRLITPVDRQVVEEHLAKLGIRLRSFQKSDEKHKSFVKELKNF